VTGFSFLTAFGRGDVRVLKAQLDLTASVIHTTRLSSVVRATVLALIASSVIGLFGHTPLIQALYVPMIVTLAIGVCSTLTALYLSHSKKADFAAIRGWFIRFLVMQSSISLAWGFMPWLLWEPHNPANHLFLAAVCFAITAGLVMSRGGNMPMFFAGLLPIATMTCARFVLGENGMDWAVAMAFPLFGFQLWYTGRPLVSRMQEDARLRFQVEDMARELEETRDEALKKRFEAEAANASKTAFLANMSHELRTPLNAILGFSEIISQECFGPVGSARYRDYATDIHSSGAHLLSLINDLLDIAKIEAGRMEISPNPLEAQRTFEIALKLIGFKAGEKRQKLNIQVDPNAPPLYADERALKQMLINLVSNAVKFTPEGGKIDVVASAAKGGGFQIMVRDNGPGIPAEKLGKVFTPFNQVDNRYDRQAGGTGLGLALVRGLAELHGGRAWLESDEGAGCSAYIVLPTKTDEATVAA
jgi:two-component system cell cycle sensor histidine kinase PleC